MGWGRLVLILALLATLPAARAAGQEAPAPPSAPAAQPAAPQFPQPPAGAPAPQAPAAAPAPQAPAQADESRWVVTHRPTEMWSDSDAGVSFGPVPEWTYLQLTGAEADGRLYVVNPRTQNYAWVDASAVGPSPAPSAADLRDPEPAPVAAPAPSSAPDWVVTHSPTQLWSDPDAGGSFGPVRQWSYFQLTGRAADGRLYELNPRTQNYAWIDAEAVGPAGPPPEWYLRQPEPVRAVQKPGRIVGGYNMRSWPAVREDTHVRLLGHNAPVYVEDAVIGEDGETWYRLSEDEYVHAEGVRLPKEPARTFGGRWIDVDLNEPAMIAAYEGDRLVYSALTIKGTAVDPTPVGVYSIIRRVANETMDSSTIGIPRNSPRGYYLRNVLYTQYFTGGGASIHYNYWSSVFGYAGSHGCLGLSLEDSLWFWNWAGMGTTLNIHY